MGKLTVREEQQLKNLKVIQFVLGVFSIAVWIGIIYLMFNMKDIKEFTFVFVVGCVGILGFLCSCKLVDKLEDIKQPWY